MADKHTLLTVEAVTDCDTGMYRIGEVDFGVHGALEHHIRKHGADDVLLTLTHLIWEVQQFKKKINAEQEQAAAAQAQ